MIEPGAGEPPQGVSPSIAAAMLGAHQGSGGGGWQPPSPEELQRDFPLYEICGILGRGGMGAVYKGWQRSLDRFVAIKILPLGFDDGVSEFSQRFKREAKAMAQLKHPGIVAVYDAGTTSGGLLYFVMECIEGTDLQHLVAEHGRLDAGEALRITSSVCDALSYAHDRGLIHRDIKPSNIMIETGGAVKVADFGLAKSTAPEMTMLTLSNVAMGTPDFMAPEALKGAADVDHRADIYAVGVMLYQMLTGEIPRGRFVPPSLAVAGLDRRLDLIVDKALQPRRTARYSSAIEVKVALDPITRSMAKRVAANTGTSFSRKTPLLLAVFAVFAVLPLVVVALIRHLGGTSPGGHAVVTRASEGSKVSGGSGPTSTAPKPAPFENSLGMKFIPVPGTDILMCIHETRRKDYAAYVAENAGVNSLWMNAVRNGVPVGAADNHPVVMVSWDDAHAFCAWLSGKEGRICRLPTDREWSYAAGIGDREQAGVMPEDLSQGIANEYPWGRQWPPPSGVGNFADIAAKAGIPDQSIIPAYEDGYATTAPVMSFAANSLGLHDVSGNVWEWCEDWVNNSRVERVLRGGAWNTDVTGHLLSS